MARIVSIGVSMAMILAAAGCGLGAGACVGVGGVVDECFQGETKSTCDAFNQEQLNGSTWTLYPGDTCAEHGLPYQCPGTGYVASSSQC